VFVIRFGVVVFPGSNCDRDCNDVVARLLGQSSVFVWHEAVDLPPVDIVILPGGFSYGDYLRAGAIARFSPVMRAVSAHAAQGRFVLGICNGFQILVEAGLLPGAFQRNRSRKFLCRSTSVRVENVDRPFTSVYSAGQVLSLPIAHAEGNYYIDPPGLSRLQDNGQILFRYCASDGTLTDNPNGSIDDIAGLCNETGNVLGMMPHPERAADPVLGSIDGIPLFQSLIGMC
jgi:phosphoribosylformylglycinamidine synthase